MKKLFYIFILLAITFSFGCKDRYPDGPLISFRSPEKRLEGTWQIVGFTSNGVDSLQYLIDSCGNNMNIHIPEPADYWNSIGIPNGRTYALGGQWNFSDNYTIMNVDFFPNTLQHVPGVGPIKTGYSGEEWKILKLESKKLEISVDYNGRTYIMSFKK